MSRALKITIWCGIVPLCFGIGIFLLWLLTRMDFLMSAGAVTACVGFWIVCVGAVSLAVFIFQSVKSGVPWKVVNRKAGLPAGLLVSNFIAFAMIFTAVIYIETAYIITVKNDSSLPIESLEVYGGGVQIDFGKIDPGDTRKKRFFIKHDGDLRYKALFDGKQRHDIIEGYVSGGFGDSNIILFEDSGKIAILDGS